MNVKADIGEIHDLLAARQDTSGHRIARGGARGLRLRTFADTITGIMRRAEAAMAKLALASAKMQAAGAAGASLPVGAFQVSDGRALINQERHSYSYVTLAMVGTARTSMTVHAGDAAPARAVQHAGGRT